MMSRVRRDIYLSSLTRRKASGGGNVTPRVTQQWRVFTNAMSSTTANRERRLAHVSLSILPSDFFCASSFAEFWCCSVGRVP